MGYWIQKHEPFLREHDHHLRTLCHCILTSIDKDLGRPEAPWNSPPVNIRRWHSFLASVQISQQTINGRHNGLEIALTVCPTDDPWWPGSGRDSISDLHDKCLQVHRFPNEKGQYAKS